MGTNIQTSGAETEIDLSPEFTLDELFEELDAEFESETRRPGDIDTAMIARRYGISDNSARERMKRLATLPGWEMVEVYDNKRYKKVLRKVSDGSLS